MMLTLVWGGLLALLLATIAYAIPAQANTITLRVDTTTASGYTGPNPVGVLDSSDGDFTPGQPIRQTPTEWGLETNDSTVFGDYVKQRLDAGYGVVYHVGSTTGTTFNWETSNAPSADTVIYAVFTSTKYSVTVVYNNDAGTPSKTIRVLPNDTLDENEVVSGVSLTKKGYTFSGWKTADGNTFNFGSPITKSMTITPVWEPSDLTEIPAYDPLTNIPATIYGTATVGDHWYSYPGGKRQSNFSCTITSDDGNNILKGWSGTLYCKNPSAAIPRGSGFSYEATLQNVDTATGRVTYDITITPPGATDGTSRNSQGLIGYQRVGGIIEVWVNIGGYAQIQKVSAETEVSSNNSLYSLAGAQFELINSKEQVAARLTTGDDGWTEVSELLPPGEYTVHEATAPNGFVLAPDTKVTVKSGETVQLPFEDQPERYKPLQGQKDDLETHKHQAQGDATLAGGVFCVKYYDTLTEDETSSMEPKRIWYVKTGDDGYAYLDDDHYLAEYNGKKSDPFFHTTDGSVVVPAGCVTWQEIAPPEGYHNNDEISIISMPLDGQTAVHEQSESFTTEDQIIRGTFKLQKWDKELGRVEPQGDGHYKDIKFAVYNISKAAVRVNGVDYAPGEDKPCFTFTLTGDGVYQAPERLLPYGTYKIVETSDNATYKQNTEWSYTFSIREEGQNEDATTKDKGVHDNIKRGGIAIQKFASEVSDGTINQSQNGTFPNTRLQSTLRLASAASGIQADNLLNAASASAVDEKTFTDMILAAAGITGQFQKDSALLTEDMFGMQYGENQATGTDPMATAQAGAAFKGAEITIWNASTHAVNISDIDGYDLKIQERGLVQPGGIVAVLTLDENGYAETGPRDLPYGTYTLKETKAPEGYHPNTNWSKTIEVREEGKIVEVGDLPETQTKYSGVDDQVYRWDYRFIKNAADTQNTLPFCPFLIVNLESGENHVITTNENGEFYSSSYVNGKSYNLHSNNTNANDDAITWNADGTYTIDDSKLDAFAGVWFTGYGPLNDPTGVLAQRVEPNDDLGAFPYGNYVLIELMGNANSGYANVVRTFGTDDGLVREGWEYDGGSIDDQAIKVRIQTTAHDAVTGDNMGSLENDTTTIVDRIEFSGGLRPDETYTFTGTLMDRNTGEPILDADGAEITASVSHYVTAAEAEDGGFVEVTFADIPSDILRGKTTVVFEDCYDDNGTRVAGHADINDEGQTVYYPDIHTTATDGVTGAHEGDATVGDTITINDEVAYTGLKPGEIYTMTGELMDKETGEPLEGVDPVSVEFTPETADGAVTVVFEVPSELVRGKTTVVFEDCYLGDREVAVHADIDDEGQTVGYPDIHTTATDGLDGDKMFSGQQDVTLVDTVEYENLTPGVEYTMTGTLYDKATGEPVPGVEPVSQTFTPDSPDGTMEMVFTFNVVDLVGHDVVVFENCYRDFAGEGQLTQVAQHADIDDEGQTVNVHDAGLADELIEDMPLAQTGDKAIGAAVVAGIVAIVTAGFVAWRRACNRA